VSDIAEFTQDPQNDPIDQTSLNADKGEELGDATIPEEVAALESATTAEREDVTADSALQLVADNVDAKRGASKAKASKRTPLAFQLHELELGAIYGEHPLVEDIRNEPSVSLRELPTSVISKSGLMELATHQPLHVVQEHEKFYCVGGLKFFRLIKYDLPPDRTLPVFLYTGLSKRALRSHILFDLFMIPALASLDMHDRRTLNEIWTRFAKEEPFERALKCEIGEAFKKLLNCDLRTGKARSESRRSKPE
jgi:hypothetical protein